MKEQLTYNIIEWTEKTGSQLFESFETLEEATEAYNRIVDPIDVDVNYLHLTNDLGGYLRVEDSEGSGYINC
mgnify:CR=1 FL=1